MVEQYAGRPQAQQQALVEWDYAQTLSDHTGIQYNCPPDALDDFV